MIQNTWFSIKERAISVYQYYLQSSWAFPIILLGSVVIAFDLLSPKLGFYAGDWLYLYSAYSRGAENISEMLFYDSRPFAGWLYTLGFKLFGFRPLNRHLLTLFFRWLAALGMWLLRSEDLGLRLISELEREASQLSTLIRIEISTSRTSFLRPLPEIFGIETPENWCSYYQCADLARQPGEWR